MFELIKKSIKDFVESAAKIIKKDEEGDRIKIEKIEVKQDIVKTVAAIITNKVKIEEKDIKEALENLEIALIEADVSIEACDIIKERIKQKIIGVEVEKEKVNDYLKNSIRETLLEAMKKSEKDLLTLVRENKKPFPILFFGTNGSGKTTTIAKIAYMLKNHGYKVLIVAADTFRAAAIEQLEEHAKRLNVDIIKGSYEQKPSAVIYNALNVAREKSYDVLLIDTAGRQELNINLMKELEKIKKIVSGFNVFVAESIVGNAILNQVKVFHELIRIDAVILTKVDLDAKGGCILSISVIEDAPPIMYVTTGQNYDDIAIFNPDFFVDKILESVS